MFGSLKKSWRLSQVIVFLLRVMQWVLDGCINFIFGLYWESSKKPIPDLQKKHDMLTKSAVTLAKMIKARKLKSEDLVRAVIERIKEVNPIINAVVADRYKQAIEEAKAVDNLIEAGLSDEEAARKPFLGVPFTTKECQAIKGMPNTFGLWSRRNMVADEDSAGVIKLKNAGAIPIAVTNVPELLVWQETRNNVYGRTNNPHHTGCSPGGSSGAEAALVATYATPISLCSDIGGSIRMPAFYCGMFGYLATAGNTDCQGLFFRDGTEESMACLGFISKHVEDLAPLTKIVAGEKAGNLNLDREIDIKDLKIFYMTSSNDVHVSFMNKNLKIAMEKAIKKLEQGTNTTPQRYQHHGFNRMYELWRHWMTKEPDNPSFVFTNRVDEAVAWKEVVKKLTGRSNHCLFSIMRLFELQYLLQPKKGPKLDKLTEDMKNDLFGKLGDNGVLIMPSAPMVAPYHYASVLRCFNFSYFGIVNALKCPAVQVPLGITKEGFPVGIQVVAAPYNDALCLAVAKYLEQHFGGAVMACQLNY